MEHVSVGAHSLAVSVTGSGPSVALLGGSGMPPAVWEICGFAPGLVDAGYRVMSYAARGVTPSDAPAGPYTIEEMTHDAAALIETLALAPCTVVGYSLGGFQAELLARTRPDLLNGAVLIASAGSLTGLLDALLDAGAELLQRLGSIPASFAVFEGLVGELAPDVLREDADQVALWRTLLGAQSDVWTSAEGECGQWHAASQWARDVGRMDALEDVSVPCLAIAYEHDLKFPPKGVHDAATRIPHCKFLQIEGAAHGGLMTHIQQTLDAVTAFLANTHHP